MPHVSKRYLKKESFRILMRQFTNALEEADSRARVGKMLDELLTKTEKIMLAKRIALIYLLSKDTPFEKIEKLLHLSPVTISKFSLKVEGGKYKQTIMIANHRGKFLDIMEKIIQARLPPRGRGRWKKIRRMTDKKIDKA
ncbi:MAG: Trp family transcriptional regulator [Candidatus Paceibacterota bacterium]